MISMHSRAGLLDLVANTARGNTPIAPGASSSWDAMYRMYNGANPGLKREIDDAVWSFATSDDPQLRWMVLFHQRHRQPEVVIPTLLALWSQHRELYGQEMVSGFTLRSHFLNALCGVVEATPSSIICRIIFEASPGAGPLPASVGTFLAVNGAVAVDALVREIKPAKNLLKAVWQAGYVLGRSAELWEFAEALALTWPVGLRKQFYSGAKSAKKRWGRK